MLYFGNKLYEISKNYLSDVDCKHCNTQSEHLLTVYCKAFVIGIFYPVKFWAFGKTGNLVCKNCGASTSINSKTNDIPEKVKKSFQSTKIPFLYRFPVFAILFISISLGLLLMMGFFVGLISTLTPTSNKIQGKWQDTYDIYTIYILDNNDYTITSSDTIIFGNYSKSGGNVSLNFIGKENVINKLKINPLILKNEENESYLFEKSEEKGEFEFMRKTHYKWRIPAQHHESNQEVKDRVISYLKCERTKFQEAADEHYVSVPLDRYSPITFAGNGIGLETYKENNWQPIFYDAENLKTANDMLLKSFPRGFKNSQYKSLYERNVAFLNMQIENLTKLN